MSQGTHVNGGDAPIYTMNDVAAMLAQAKTQLRTSALQEANQIQPKGVLIGVVIGGLFCTCVGWTKNTMVGLALGATIAAGVAMSIEKQ